MLFGSDEERGKLFMRGILMVECMRPLNGEAEDAIHSPLQN